jgi:putative permease
VYLLLLPLLVFFFLKDKEPLLAAFTKLLPKDRELIDKIWHDVEEKTASYVRGTLWRMLIVGLVSGIAFIALGFNYGALMGALTGLSVLIPYVGAVAVALPLALLGYAQWGMTWDLGTLMIAYAVIQVLDGYVLVPYLFSIAVKLHPVTIVMATFVFGSIWGFWGLIFAIPLATLVKSFLLTVIEHQEELT